MRRGAALLALVVVMAACGTPTDRSASTPSTASAAPFGAVAAVGGGRIDGHELAGRDLALWFWAPW